MMKIFRQLRWKMTLSYTLVTVGALLVITLIMGGIAFSQIFIPIQYFDPEQLIDAWMNSRISSNYPTLCQILSQSPVDMELLNVYYERSSVKYEYSISLFRIGALDFSVTTKASIRSFIFSPDGILLGTSVPDDPVFGLQLGSHLTLGGSRSGGSLSAALAGDRTPKHLYTELVPNQKIVFAGPLFNRTSGYEDQVVGVVVIIFDAIPTNENIPAYTPEPCQRSLIIFLLGAGIMGAIFGSYFAHGLVITLQAIILHHRFLE